MGLIAFVWWLLWESDRKKKVALALKQKEMDSIKEDNNLKEEAMHRIGGEPILRTAEAIVAMEKKARNTEGGNQGQKPVS